MLLNYGDHTGTNVLSDVAISLSAFKLLDNSTVEELEKNEQFDYLFLRIT